MTSPRLKVIKVSTWQLKFVTEQYNTQRVFDKAVRDDSSTLQFVSDWFVTQQQMDVWYDDDYCFHDDEIIEWYKGYKKRMAQKVKIKEELLPVAWHVDRVKGWSM